MLATPYLDSVQFDARQLLVRVSKYSAWPGKMSAGQAGSIKKQAQGRQVTVTGGPKRSETSSPDSPALKTDSRPL